MISKNGRPDLRAFATAVVLLVCAAGISEHSLAQTPPPPVSPRQLATALKATLDPKVGVITETGKTRFDRVPTIGAVLKDSVGKGMLQAGENAFSVNMWLPYGKPADGSAAGFDTEMSRLTEVGGWAYASALIVMVIPEFYKDRTFQPETATLYLARLRSLAPDQVSQWCQALNRFEQTYCPAIPVYLIRMRKMFEGAQLNKTAYDAALARASILPVAVVEAWGKAAGIDNTTAVFSLLQVEALFSGGTFQRKSFDAAVPLAN